MFIMIFVSTTTAFVFSAAQYVAFGDLIDRIKIAETGADWAYFLTPIYWLLFYMIGAHILYRAVQFFEIFSVQPALAKMRHVITAHALGRSPEFFTNERAGSIATRISNLPLSYYRVFKFFQWTGVGEVAYVVFTVATAFTFHVYLGLALLIWVCLLFIQNGTIIKYLIHPSSYDMAKARGWFGGAMTDLITNALLVIMHGKNDHFPKNFNDSIENEKKTFQKARWYAMFYQAALGFSEVILISCVIFLGAYLCLEGEITTGAFVTIIMLSFRTVDALWSISVEVPGLIENWTSTKEGLDFLYSYDEQKNENYSNKIKMKHSPSLSFENVAFRYKDDLPDVFNNFNLEVKSGESIGIVGESGAGKTTLVSLLLRFYDPTQGVIKLDDKNIEDFDLNSYRQLFSVIPQDTSLFHRSIMENIRFGREDASDEEVFEAAKKARADQFIAGLTKGYDALVGDRGVKLSGGQRQRIAIARAFLRNSPILVLDEATSALDSQTETLVKEALDELMKGKTAFVIAHRLSTVSSLDRIIVMDQGRIIEQGTHNDLIKSSKHYKDLWDLQTGQAKISKPLFSKGD